MLPTTTISEADAVAQARASADAIVRIFQAAATRTYSGQPHEYQGTKGWISNKAEQEARRLLVFGRFSGIFENVSKDKSNQAVRLLEVTLGEHGELNGVEGGRSFIVEPNALLSFNCENDKRGFCLTYTSDALKTAGAVIKTEYYLTRLA